MERIAQTVSPVAGSPGIQPGPFIKWAGGKSRLLEQYEAVIPREIDRYHEPFVGGGAVFFHFQPTSARLTDINPRLVGTYRAIRDDVHGVIDRLEVHRERHEKGYYYDCRQRFNEPRGLNASDRAALFIYLNKTCYNGLYRENQSGGFNVPMGSYKQPGIFEVPQLIAASAALQNVEIERASFEAVLDHAKPGDVVYFDPPYVPLSTTSSFTNYFAEGFDNALQIKLARTFDALAKRGCQVFLSNSDTPAVRELYAGYRIHQIMAPRSINSKGDSRGKVAEVLVAANA